MGLCYLILLKFSKLFGFESSRHKQGQLGKLDFGKDQMFQISRVTRWIVRPTVDSALRDEGPVEASVVREWMQNTPLLL